jgi:hypothetical protein
LIDSNRRMRAATACTTCGPNTPQQQA